jgi:hypothetical protein
MADAPQDPLPSSPEDPAAGPAPAGDGAVELSGYLDEGPVGFIRLFEDAARCESYVDIKLQDVVRLFPEDAPDAAPGVTVIAVRGDAVVLICEPVDAQALADPPPEVPSLQEKSVAAPVTLKPVRPPIHGGVLDHPDGWPRRKGA